MIQRKFLMTLAAASMLQNALIAAGDQPVSVIPDENLLIAVSPALKESDSTATKFQGVYITSKREDILSEGRPNLKGIVYEDFIYEADESKIKEIIEPYFGRPLTPQILADLREALSKYFKTVHPAARVLLPEQHAMEGVIQILISPFTLGETRYKGNEWYSEAYLSRHLHISSGKEIADETLLNDLSWINRNPFQRVSASYVPSDVPGIMDLEIKTIDRFPLRIYGRSDNSGNATTGVMRFATGFSWGNAFWVGDILTYEYCTSNIEKRVLLNKFNYSSFLPWRHILTISGNYNITKPVVVFGESKTVNYGSRLRYTIPFKPLFIPFGQDITFGADWKHYMNQTLSRLTGLTKFKTLNETILYLSYTVSDTLGSHNFSIAFENYWSPFHFLDKQEDSDFAKFRPFARNHFYYCDLTASYTYYLPLNFAIAVLSRLQRANHTLPSSELMGAGGYSTVRGYKECVAAGDNAFIANFEFRTPPITYFRKLKDKFILLGFVDYGFVNNFKVLQPTQPNKPRNHVNEYLFSTGAGARYNINPYLSFRCDYGFKLHDLYYTSKIARKAVSGYGRWHMGLLLSY
jgi:hemolysin activation/secretion protein